MKTREQNRNNKRTEIERFDSGPDLIGLSNVHKRANARGFWLVTQRTGPGCSKQGKDNPGLVRNLNSDMEP